MGGQLLILAVFSGINGCLTETRAGFNSHRAKGINKLEKQAGTPLIASMCKIRSSAGSVFLKDPVSMSNKSKLFKDFRVGWLLKANLNVCFFPVIPERANLFF